MGVSLSEVNWIQLAAVAPTPFHLLAIFVLFISNITGAEKVLV